MRVQLGAAVVCSDGQQVGTVDRLVIDPVTQKLLQLIVRQGRWTTQDRLIDRHFIEGVGVNGAVRLTVPSAKVDELPQFYEAQFVTPQASWNTILYPKVGGANYSGLGVSGSFAATAPLVKASGPGGGYSGGLPGDVIGAGGYGELNFEVRSNLPTGALLIDRGTKVVDSKEQRLGEVDDFVYNAEGTITGFRVRGGLFGRRRASVPVSAVATATPDLVRLNIPAAEVDRVAQPEEAPSRLVVLAFDQEGTSIGADLRAAAVGNLPHVDHNMAAAAGMLEHVRTMEARGLLLLDDAVIAAVLPNGTVELTQTRSDTGRFALRGAGAGALLGLLLGGPLGGLAAGATIGAISGAANDSGLDDNFVRSLAARLRPGRSALFLLVRRADFAAVLEDLRPFRAEILHADLSPDRAELLRDALAKEEMR